MELAMDETRQLADAIFRDRVLRAREMPGEEKLRAGFELFEFACGITRAGIKYQNPHADEAEVEHILAERLALQRRLEIGQWKATR
jgi:hypothetical protein